MSLRPTGLGRRSAWIVVVACASIGVACSVSSSSTSGNDAGGGGSCPCTVGNSGLQFTLGCGEDQCLTLNGTETGYRCGPNGATVDPAVCQPGFDAGSGRLADVSLPPPCMAKSCADQGLACGTIDDTCGNSIVCPACASALYCSAANQCLARAENVAIYGNISGGTFGIEVDTNVPNLGIGLIANSPMSVTFSGAYVGNIVAVYLATNNSGFGDTGATLSDGQGGTFSGIAPSLVTQVRLPLATADAGIANDRLDCETPSSQPDPGCNPPAQVEDFFATTLGGKVLFNNCQAQDFTGTVLLSAGGSCM